MTPGRWCGEAIRSGTRTSARAALWLGGCGLALLAACGSDPAYRAPSFAFAERFLGARGQPSPAPVLLANRNWWARLGDPLLDRLVAQALAGNLDLVQARERIAEARAARRAVPGATSLAPAASVQAIRDGGIETDSQTASLSLSWLADPFGGRRAELAAAGARAEAAETEVQAAQLAVLSDLATSYLDLRWRQRLLAVQRQDLASRRQTIELTRAMIAGGAATQLDLTRSQAAAAEAEAEIPALEAAIAGQVAAIAVLTGRPPGGLAPELTRGLAGGRGQPRPSLAPEVGIPADLLRNRPDIRTAERLYYAAIADTGVARAALYPKLSLGGAITLGATGGRSSTDYYFGPSLQFPSLINGAARGQVAATESRARQAHTVWKATVLQAILETEQALADYAAAGRSVAAADKTLRLRREVERLTRELVEQGGATVTDLIDAEEDRTRAETALAGAVRTQGASFVALNVALGTGSAYGAPVAATVAAPVPAP